MQKERDSRCVGCIYYGKSTRTCDYILIEDRRRPCPPGDDCTERRTKRKAMAIGRVPKWDTEMGRLLYLDGRSDEQIAEELGVSKTAVTNYRLRHWGKANDRSQDAPEQLEQESAPLPAPAEKKLQCRSVRQKLRRFRRSAWQPRMGCTAFWKRRPNPKTESKQSARLMQFFASGIGAVRTICAEPEPQLIF